MSVAHYTSACAVVVGSIRLTKETEKRTRFKGKILRERTREFAAGKQRAAPSSSHLVANPKRATNSQTNNL